MATFTFIRKAKEDMLVIGQSCNEIRAGYSKYLVANASSFIVISPPVKSKFCMPVWI